MSKGILIYSEITSDDYVHTVVFELSNKAVELAQKLDNVPVMALLLVKPDLINEYKEAFQKSGFDKVFYVVDERFGTYSTDLFAKAAIQAVKQIDPEIMLIGATCQGRDLAPRISTALHTGLTADCTGLDILDNGKLAATRPTFGGQLMATILCKNLPQMATVRPKVFKPAREDILRDTTFIKLSADLSDYEPKTEILEFSKKFVSEINSLDSADIIVAGGKGMKNAEGFELLKRLADKLGGTVGASRVAVEMGLASPDIQVGQTGKTVHPKIYIALGISGAIQHKAGMQESECIIAVNKNAAAPIFEIADYGINGDLFKVGPMLIEAIKAAKAAK